VLDGEEVAADEPRLRRRAAGRPRSIREAIAGPCAGRTGSLPVPRRIANRTSRIVLISGIGKCLALSVTGVAPTAAAVAAMSASAVRIVCPRRAYSYW
jgi:hypothetical protein